MYRRYVVVLAALTGVLVIYALNIREASWTGSNARAVEQRGPLSDAERANIEIFEKVSPSVVQGVAAQSTANPLGAETEGGLASGTGFVSGKGGHGVTNNHAVQNVNQ